MWTNVFRIGGFHHVSWFQLLPHEADLNSLPDKSVKVEQHDAATLIVLSSHLQLQKEGYFSTWTNSFVGPWDPSQGLHNPDEKVKLWLFLPGQHSAIDETAQAAVSRLKVVAYGMWSAPGDSEEVAAALSQALRNRIGRSMLEVSYMRFGDVFARYLPSSQSEELFRRGHPTIEFVFAATEEAVFVHVIISAKHIRALGSGDIDRLSNLSNRSSIEKLPVIVSPHGMRGWISGCSPADLVKQVYTSSGMSRTSNGVIGLPYHIYQGSSGQLRGQTCYIEVNLGCPGSKSDGTTKSQCLKNFQKYSSLETQAVGSGQKGSTNQFSCSERTFIYPTEAVLIPVLQITSARSSLKRFWLQSWIGPLLSGSSLFMHCSDYISVDNDDAMNESCIEANRTRSRRGYNSSSNSNSSSISSISCSTSDTDCNITTGDLEADADSLTCRQSGLSSKDQVETDNHILGSKRSRTGISETYGQVVNNPAQSAYRSEFGSLEVNNSAITGVENEQIGSRWDWDDDDRGIGTDIQALLSEFGDFGDFFESDSLTFGEPPGTAESQALVYSGPDCGDMSSSPCAGVMGVADQMFLPVGLPSSECVNPPIPVAVEECYTKNQEGTTSPLSVGPMNSNAMVPSGEFDHLIKAEAMMTFAPEFGAVQTPACDLSLSIFRSPYLPKSRKSESPGTSPKNHPYGAAPPSPPCLNGSEDKLSMSVNSKLCVEGRGANDLPQLGKYYTYTENRKDQNRKLSPSSNIVASGQLAAPSSFCGFNSINTVNSAYRISTEGSFKTEPLFLSMKTALATEVECIMFQAFMCRVRHTVPSSKVSASIGLNRLTGNIMNQLPAEPSSLTDNISAKFEVKMKDIVPVSLGGDNDGVQDGPLSAPVGVWRSVGGPKSVKSTSSGIEICPPMTHNSFIEDAILSYEQKQPLQDLLDGLVLLVQQATSFVDLSLDADFGDGIYGWLALEEQQRRALSCGPSMIHAGCGGSLASCHSLDMSGTELADPLSADVHASSVISLLQSDIKAALKAAFSSLDGPLFVSDWCKGRAVSGDAGDGFSSESTVTESKDSSSTVTLSLNDPISPCQSSASGLSCLKASSGVDGVRVDETCHWQQAGSRSRPTLHVTPLPAILVGYQDDWLKTSANSIQQWEKAPFEPYALPKPITYCVVCPDIDPLTSAATDFFQQLGTVYETCRLGNHSPQNVGNQMDIDSTKSTSSGFVLLGNPQSMKTESSNASLLGSISDYFLSLSNGWDLTTFLKSLSRALRALKLGSWLASNPKEGSSCSSMVIYVVCPFPEPAAVLQTIIESSVAVGSSISFLDKERRSLLHSQVGKALSCSTAVDEASLLNILALSGFSIPKLVVQIVTLDAIFRVTSPALNELVVLKEYAFTVYNKARRISRGCPNDSVHSASLLERSSSLLMQVAPPNLGIWKDSLGSRTIGPSISRDSELDTSSRPGSWDNSWQVPRAGGMNSDSSWSVDSKYYKETRYLFEPLFILADPGSLEHGVSPTILGNLASESSKLFSDESSGFMQASSSAGSADTGLSSQLDGPESDGFGYGHQKNPPSIHCCYGWTEDWRWLVCMWTDSRGELLDSNIFPFGGISSRQDTKGMQCLFVQVLQQGCLLLQSCSSDSGIVKPRDFVITRIGCFFELECQEWQKAIYAVGGSDVKRWPVHLRRSVSDVMSVSSNGSSLQQQERTLPSSSSSLYSSQSKGSGFVKGGLGQPTSRKQLMGGHMSVDSSRSLLQWVQSISLVTVSVDHSLQLVLQADSSSGISNTSSKSGGTQGGSAFGLPGYLEGFSPVKSLGATSAAYILIPSPSMRFLPQMPLQLPTCLTAESPPLAHLLHSKGSAIPFSTCFVVSKAVPSMRKDSSSSLKEEWPSVLSVGLIDYYGGNSHIQEKMARGTVKQGARNLSSEGRDSEIDMHSVLEFVAAELHALSWMTVSPAYLDRRTALPFHCDMVTRLRRLLHFADKDLFQRAEGPQVRS